MSDKHSNESSYSDDVHPYACADNASANSGDQEEGLLRTMSEFNDMTVTSGEARENEHVREEDIEKGVSLPAPLRDIPSLLLKTKP